MGEVVICAASWALALWTGLRCRRAWRGGADRLGDAKWDTLASALATAAFAVMATSLLRLPINPLVFASLTTALTLASITCVFAKRRAVHRADTEIRAMRAALGLPTERRMRRPVALVTLWGMAAVAVGTGWLVMAILRMTSRPTAAGEWPEMGRAIDTAVIIAVCFLAAGALHGLTQQVRIDRERRRIRNADHQYLSNDTN